MEDDFDFEQGGEQGAGQEQGEEGFETLGEEPAAIEEEQQQEPPAAVKSNNDSMLRRASSDGPPMAPTSGAPSEATNKWKVENDKKIKQRDAEFTKAKQDLTKKAEQALDKIRSERAQLIAKNAKANREAQAKSQAAANSKSAPGAPVSWQKLAQLVDLEKETTDRERMRALFKTKVAEAKS